MAERRSGDHQGYGTSPLSMHFKNGIHEKGTNVTDQERSKEAQRISTSFLAMFRALLTVSRRGTRPIASTAAFAGMFATATIFVGVVGATPALAAGGPIFGNEGAPKALYIHATRATIRAELVDLKVTPTRWRVEYSREESGVWTLAADGETKDKVGQDALRVSIHHLSPNTTYDFQVGADNSAGSVEGTTRFTTGAAGPPEVQGGCGGTDFRAIGFFTEEEVQNGGFKELCARPHTTSIDLESQVESDGANTEYNFEYATSEAGPYDQVPGASGTVTAAEDFAYPEFTLSGLAPKTKYYPRVTVTNEKGSHVTRMGSIVTNSTKPEASIERGQIAQITDVSAHLLGGVNPGTYETHWQFEYATSDAGPYIPVPGASGTITTAGAGEESLSVEGNLSGLSPAGMYYVRLFAENVNGTSTSPSAGFETAGPPLASTFAVHALHGETMRALGSVRPDGVDTHYRFQYVGEDQYAVSGWAEAQSTPEVDAGAGPFKVAEGGYPTVIVGSDLPGLTPGDIYDYRLLASNETGAAQGATQTLTVPSPAAAGEPVVCPNEALRTGPSAGLSDCRAYEQITPVDKEGAQEIANYGGALGGPGALVGEDGEHIMFADEIVNWGPGPHDGQTPYFFTRTATGWRMTAAAIQPETGIFRPGPRLFNPDLTDFAFENSYNTGEHGVSSHNEFKVGPPGGPYTLLASVPAAQSGSGLVAGSEDFSKLVLQVEDRNLGASPSGTKNGDDLYEYAEGKLRQVNVLTGGAPIGSCGAKIVKGNEELGQLASRHAVSADGSRVFFEAVPGSACGAPSHLFERIGGVETVDLGAYRFFGANRRGSEVLLEKQVGEETREVFLYEAASASVSHLFTSGGRIGQASVSEDSESLSSIYFYSREQVGGEAPPISSETGPNAEDLYRYDIPNRTLGFVVQVGFPGSEHVSPDGRYFYFEAPSETDAQPTGHAIAGLPGGAHNTTQVYRYDSVENLIECVSCASPFDPEPAQPSVFGSNFHLGRALTVDGLPNVTVASANGDFVFFSTPAALLPSDVDGEVTPEISHGDEHVSLEDDTSVSSDIYEWRRNGIDGCTRVQGCLSLITNGRGGFMNLFIGSADEGRDVFFITGSQLVGSDQDTALDIYDARIGGGFPPPPLRPVECEGDACSTPFAPPSDPTPSSATFQGAGNQLVMPPEVKSKPKPKKKVKSKKRKGRKAGTRHTSKVGRARGARTSGRASK